MYRSSQSLVPVCKAMQPHRDLWFWSTPQQRLVGFQWTSIITGLSCNSGVSVALSSPSPITGALPVGSFQNDMNSCPHSLLTKLWVPGSFLIHECTSVWLTVLLLIPLRWNNWLANLKMKWRCMGGVVQGTQAWAVCSFTWTFSVIYFRFSFQQKTNSCCLDGELLFGYSPWGIWLILPLRLEGLEILDETHQSILPSWFSATCPWLSNLHKSTPRMIYSIMDPPGLSWDQQGRSLIKFPPAPVGHGQAAL